MKHPFRFALPGPLRLLGFALLLGLPVLAGRPLPDGTPSVPPPPAPPIRAEAERVVVPVTVTGADGKVVRGLRQADFKLYVDGKEVRDFLFLDDQDAPATVGVLIDRSSVAVGRQIPWVRNFLEGFFHRTDRKDSLFLATYGLEWEVIVPATSDRSTLMGAIYNLDPVMFRDAKTKWAGKPGETRSYSPFNRGFPPNKTAIALDRALYELARAQTPRKAILLVSDGDENLSKVTLNHIQYFGVPVYTLYAEGSGFGERSLFRRGAMVKRLSLESGGARVTTGEGDNPVDAGKGIADLVRNQYLISFVPDESLKRSKTHTVLVRHSREDLTLSYRRSFRFVRE